MEQAEFTTENIKYDLLGMHETLTARGFNRNQVYTQIRTQLNTQGYNLSQEDLESTILETKSQLKRYQNHTREMFEYQDKLLRYFKNATEKEKTKEDAMFVVQRDFRRLTGYDLETEELEYVLTHRKPEPVEEPLKKRNYAIWKLYTKHSKPINEISLMYNTDPLYVEEAVDYWMGHPQERPIPHKKDTRQHLQSRDSKRLTINVKSMPNIVGVIKEEPVAVKIPQTQIFIPRIHAPEKQGILERTAIKLSAGLNRAFGFFLTKPAYVRC